MISVFPNPNVVACRSVIAADLAHPKILAGRPLRFTAKNVCVIIGFAYNPAMGGTRIFELGSAWGKGGAHRGQKKIVFIRLSTEENEQQKHALAVNDRK